MTSGDIQDIIDDYIKAERAVLKGKAYTIAGRSLSRENLSEIREGRQEWEQKLVSQSARQLGQNSNYSMADFT